MTEAYITLLINDAYLPGSLLLANVLKKKFATERKLIILTAGISTISREKLSEVYDEIIPIDDALIFDHKSATLENLKLLNRLDLNLTFNKIHIFNQTKYTKLVYLDSDILPIKPLDELFDITVGDGEVAASPDSGWPDIFNSGLLVFKPSSEAFEELKDKVTSTDDSCSFDGADQGLLNQHFRDNWVRLPFTYNVTFTNHYEYLPALNFYLSEIKSYHFIGIDKPWSTYEFSKFNQLWWDDFNSFFKEEEKQLVLSLAKSSAAQGEAANLQIPGLCNQWDKLSLDDKPEEGQKDEENNDDQGFEVAKIFPWEEYKPEPTRVFTDSTDFYVNHSNI